MKTYFFLLLSFLFFGTAGAQTKESVYNAMADDLCKEIKAKEAELKNSEDIQVDIGLLMMPIFMKYENDMKKADPKFKLSDQTQVEALGFEIGKRLVTCVEFMKLASVQKQIVQEIKADKASIATMDGVLQSVTTGDFSAINVKTSTGKTEKIWWMGYFPGADKLKDGSLINKQVKIRYSEKEVYNSTLKDYIKIKIAEGIE